MRRRFANEPAIRLVGRHLPAPLLDRRDPREADQAAQRLRRVGHRPGPDRSLEEHDWCSGRVEDAPVVNQRRLLVLEQRPSVGREDHQRVRPRGLHVAGVCGGGEAVLDVHACDHGAAAADRLGRDLDDPTLVGEGHRRVLAGVPVHEEAGQAGNRGELRQQGAQARLVERERARQRGRRRRVDSAERSRTLGNHGGRLTSPSGARRPRRRAPPPRDRLRASCGRSSLPRRPR